MMQTRHTFATISLSQGENIGWVQHRLSHRSLSDDLREILSLDSERDKK